MGPVLSDIEREKISAVFKALKYEDLDRLKQLIEADPGLVEVRSSADRTPLHTAARRGLREAVAFLLAMGADPEARDYRNWTPLDWALDHQRLDVAELLRSHRRTAPG